MKPSVLCASCAVVAMMVTLSATAEPVYPDILVESGIATASMSGGDLDGDGHLDLVVTNNFAPDHGALLGKGNGTFAPMTRFGPNAGDSAVSTAIGDLNEDGNDDVVVANRSYDTVSVYPGHGDGTFGLPTDFPVGDFAEWVVLGYFDGDTHLDVAVTNLNSNDVSILLGDGLGGFTPQTRWPVAQAPGQVETGDLDGDSHADLVVGNRTSDSVSVLLGNGDGSFQPRQDYPAGDDPASLTLGDFDEDGILDVVVINVLSADVSLLLGNGDGTLGPETRFPAGVDPRSVDAADVDGDGHTDLIVADYAVDQLSVSLGTGSGGFLPPVGYPTCDGPRRVLAADVDHDSHADVLVACLDSGHVAFHPGAGDGTFPPGGTRWTVGSRPWGVATGDLDGDGLPDVVTANALSGDVSSLINDGGVAFETEVRTTTGDFPAGVGLADFDEDGILDAVTANLDTDDVWILIGTGTGAFAPQAPIPTAVDPQAVAIGDFNGDGHVDVAVGYGGAPAAPVVSVLIGAGNGSFSVVETPLDAAPYAVATADLDGDPHLDLIAVHRYSDEVSPLRGAGDGTFTTGTSVPVGDHPCAVATGDFNEDGALDAAVANWGSEDVSLLLGNGDGTFQSERRVGPVRPPQAIAVHDLDGDGHQDLAVPSIGSAGTDGESVVVIPGRGDGTFGDPVGHRVGRAPRGVATLDVERDGRVDLVVGNYYEADVTLLVNTGRIPPVVRFGGDKATLSWAAVVGAVSYNVYRGELEGLPAGDHGQCQNARDPSLTDTEFIDDDEPVIGGGFTYLVAWRGGDGVERGLGTDQNGDPRDPLPCP